MMPPPNKPNTLATWTRWFEGSTTVKQYGLPVKTFDASRTDISGYSGKFPNNAVPGPVKGAWRPCKPYRRFGARYSPSGYAYGEQTYMGQLEWEKKTTPLGFQPSTTYLWTGINAPFGNEGAHPWMDSNTETRLITECLIKVQSRKANYGEAIAESRRTVNHLAHTVTRVVNIFLGIRRRDPKLLAKGLGLGRKRYSGLASAHWLEYQYAWLPLMSDIYDTSQLLAKGFGDRPQLIRAVRKLESTSGVDLTVGGSVTAKGSVTVTDRCILFYKVKPSTLSKMGQLGLINPLEVVWAIVPYSFVVDWFIPVGNLLQALTATIGLDFVDGCLSRTAQGSRTLECITAGTRYPYKKDKSTYKCVSAHKSFERRAISSPPLPGLYFKNPFSVKRATSALALLAQLSRR